MPFAAIRYIFGVYESGENYLEAILMLQERNGSARSADVARKLDVSRPSVSRAMSILKQEGYIDIAESGAISFTPKGTETAGKIYNRHRQLTDFIAAITGVPLEQAEENACKIEHVIDEDVFAGILRYMADSGRR